MLIIAVPLSDRRTKSPAFHRSYFNALFTPSNIEGEPTVLKLYPLGVSLKGARAGNADRQVRIANLRCPACVDMCRERDLEQRTVDSDRSGSPASGKT